MDKDIFNCSQYHFEIPGGLIAQEPVSPRDSSRLLVVDRKNSSIKEGIFKQILTFFKRSDVLVLNNTEVIRARLFGKTAKGSKIEVLLLKECEEGIWEVLAKPSKRARQDSKIIFSQGVLEAMVIGKTEAGSKILSFSPARIEDILPKVGKVPLPPYIKKEVQNVNDYQTVYAEKKGAVAAPTAGLHFTEGLLDELIKKGVEIVYVTLHCGLATFRPVKTNDVREHKIESEWIEISASVTDRVNLAKKEGRRIVAVGTTATRSLESVAFFDNKGMAQVKPFKGETNLYIVPGYKFKIIDSIITNFHTPCSTNLVLVASFCGLGLIKQSYAYAKAKNFRFFSFGDAMLIH